MDFEQEQSLASLSLGICQRPRLIASTHAGAQALAPSRELLHNATRAQVASLGQLSERR